MKETNVKRVWARVGMTYVLPEDEYKKLIEAAKKNDKENVRRILKAAVHYEIGDSYLPADADDNPDFDFDF